MPLKIETAQYGKNLATLLALTTFIFGFSYMGSSLFDSLFGEEEFAEAAAIGSISVAGLTRNDAKQKIEASLEKWKEKNRVYITQRGKESALTAGAFEFDIDNSVEKATLEGESPLVVHIKGRILEDSLSHLADPNLVELNELNKALADMVSSLPQNDLKLDITYYFKQPVEDRQVVISELILNREETPALLSSIQKLDGLKVEPGQAVSFLSLLEKDPSLGTDNLNIITGGLYEALLYTNFQIIERHISRFLPTYSKQGFEAKVVPGKMDFIFKNPNPTAYSIHLNMDQSSLKISIKGLPLAYRYRPVLTNKEEFKEKTIVHFNPQLGPDEERIREAGRPGSLVKVYRERLIETIPQEKEWVSDDFYPPVHRVIEKSPTDPTDLIFPEGLEGQQSPNEQNLDEGPLPNGEQQMDPAAEEFVGKEI